MGKGTRNRQFTKLQGLKTFKHPALDVWGFSLSRKETQREGRQPHRNKEYHIASSPVWLPPQGRRPYFSATRRLQGWRRLNAACYTRGLGSPRSPASTQWGQGTSRIHITLPASTPGDFSQPLLPDLGLHPHLSRPSSPAFGFISSLLLQAHCTRQVVLTISPSQQLCCEGSVVITQGAESRPGTERSAV